MFWYFQIRILFQEACPAFTSADSHIDIILTSEFSQLCFKGIDCTGDQPFRDKWFTHVPFRPTHVKRHEVCKGVHTAVGLEITAGLYSQVICNIIQSDMPQYDMQTPE